MKQLKKTTPLLFVLIFISCDLSTNINLAVINEVTPKTIESGDILSIKGEGFVPGPARITFQGFFHPDSLQKRKFDLTFWATCISTELVQLEITNTKMTAMTSVHGKFKGKILIHFNLSAINKPVTIFGELKNVSLTFIPSAKSTRRSTQMTGTKPVVTAVPDSTMKIEGDKLASMVFLSIFLGLLWALLSPVSQKLKTSSKGEKSPIEKKIDFGALFIVTFILGILTMIPRDSHILFFSIFCLFIVAAVLENPFTIKGRKNIITAIFLKILPAVAIWILCGQQSGSLDLQDMVTSQTLLWHSWSSPFALFTFFFAMILFGVGSDWEQIGIIHHISRWFVLSFVCVTCAVGFLGGWSIPWLPAFNENTSPGMLIFYFLIFLTKVWIVLITIRWISRSKFKNRRKIIKLPGKTAIKVLLFFIFYVLASIWSAWEMPTQIAMIGNLLAIAIFSAFFAAYIAMIAISYKKTAL